MTNAAARNFVRRRADNRCEYCLLRQEFSDITHHIEHIIAKQHGGSDDLENLAFACCWCNFCKGPNLSGFDFDSDHIVRLFHPRRDRWADHFITLGPRIEGMTDVGRATVLVLGMNDPDQLHLRAELLALGKLD